MKENIEDIYGAYFNDIYHFLLSLCHNHHTAEDILQETFFRAFLHLESYKEGSVKAWLYTVAYHAYVDYYRKNKKMIIKEQSFFMNNLDKNKSVEERILLQEEIQEIKNLLNDLPEKHKCAVLLADFHELSTIEAAEILNVTASYFKVLLFRGRQAIRKRRGNSK